MREKMLIFFALVSCPAFTQINSGTIIIFNFTEDQLVVAADSRGVDFNAGEPQDLECKITTLNHQFVFASAGSVRFSSTVSDTISSWDNAALAREVIGNVAKEKQEIDIEAVANEWAGIVRDHWNSLCNLRPLMCAKLTEARNGLLTSGMFFKAKNKKISMGAAEFFFDMAGLAKLLSEMLEYWKLRKAIPLYGYHVFNPALHEECKKIVARLQGEAPIENVDALTPNSNEKDFDILAESIRQSIEKNQPEEALDRLHTFVVKYMREICSRHSISYQESTPLHSLFGGYIKYLATKDLGTTARKRCSTATLRMCRRRESRGRTATSLRKRIIANSRRSCSPSGAWSSFRDMPTRPTTRCNGQGGNEWTTRHAPTPQVL
jgi:hypothetical protein